MKFKEVLISIAIAIVFMLFIIYGLNTFYAEPEYTDYCTAAYPDNIHPKQTNVSLCIQIEEQNIEAIDKCNREKGQPRYTYDENGCQILKECDMCSVEYNARMEAHNKAIFIIANIIGLAAIIAGIILTVKSISAGLIGGGILTIFYGTIRYWGNLEDYARFIILGIVLGVLIWIGYKKLNK